MTSGLPAPATLFPHPVFRDNQCIPGSAAISSLQSAPRQIQSASATISAPPVRATTNTVRLRNYFRNSVRAATNTFRLRDHFRPSSPRRDKYIPPPQLFPSLQSAPRQIQSASATISAIQSASRQIQSASATISVTPVCAATNTFRLRDHFRPSSPRRDKYSPPPQPFPQFSPRRDKYVPPPRPFPQFSPRRDNTFRLRNYFRNSAHKFSCSSEIIQHQLHTLFPNLLPYQHIPRTAVINHHTSPPFSPSLSSL